MLEEVARHVKNFQTSYTYFYVGERKIVQISKDSLGLTKNLSNCKYNASEFFRKYFKENLPLHD